MRTALVSVIMLAAAVWVVAAPARPSPGTAAPVPEGRPTTFPDFEVRLADDSVLKVALLDPSVVVATRYGKLSVPMADVRRVDFGLRYPAGVQDRIEQAIGDLGSPDYETREAAEKALVGHDYLAIQAARRAVKSSDPEVSRRADNVVRRLEATVPEERLEVRDFDVVETPEFTIRGRIEATEFKARSRHLGDLTLRLCDVQKVRGIGGGSKSDIVLDAATYGTQTKQRWLATAVEVSSGQTIEITATGSIDLWPQQPGQYTCGPDGMGNGLNPNVLPGPGALGPGGAARVRNPVGGQVVARIGSEGSPFAVGSSFKGKAPASGKVYLQITPSPWGNESSGSYKVKVGTFGD